MSQGGFSGKGMFASMAYLVVEYDGGKQKQCNFKDERDVDALLEVLAKEQPNIPRLSAAGEAEIARQKAEKAARSCPSSRRRQSRAWASSSAHRTTSPRNRSLPKSSAPPSAASAPSCRASRCINMWPSSSVCSAWCLRPMASRASSTTPGNYGIYFALFGFAAIFLFSSYNRCLRPTTTIMPS
mgnify:CR=1 FL=1